MENRRGRGEEMKRVRGQVLDEISGKIMHDDEALKVAA